MQTHWLLNRLIWTTAYSFFESYIKLQLIPTVIAAIPTLTFYFILLLFISFAIIYSTDYIRFARHPTIKRILTSCTKSPPAASYCVNCLCQLPCLRWIRCVQVHNVLLRLSCDNSFIHSCIHLFAQRVTCLKTYYNIMQSQLDNKAVHLSLPMIKK